MEDGEVGNKRARSSEQEQEDEAEVKQDSPQGRVSQGGDGQGGLPAAEEAMQVPWVAADAEVNLLFFQCLACQLPLKPPVHKCEGGQHLVCGSCHGDNCTFCDPPTAYAPCSVMDGAIAAVLLPCRYKNDGCERKLKYYEEADHALQCAFAPCHCPGHGCRIWASPPALLHHIATAHSWPVTNIRYRSVCRLAVPPPWRGTHLLLEPNGQRVFLVALSDMCEATAVSVVCVRDGTPATARPKFRCNVWAEVASDPGKSINARVPALPSSSNGNLPGVGQPVCLVVPPGFGNHSEDLHLSLRIDQI